MDNSARSPRISIVASNPVDVGVGINLAFRRAMLGLTIASLSDRTKIGLKLLKQIEAGEARATAVQLQTLCEVLHMTPRDVYAAFDPR